MFKIQFEIKSMMTAYVWPFLDMDEIEWENPPAVGIKNSINFFIIMHL